MAETLGLVIAETGAAVGTLLFADHWGGRSDDLQAAPTNK